MAKDAYDAVVHFRMTVEQLEALDNYAALYTDGKRSAALRIMLDAMTAIDNTPQCVEILDRLAREATQQGNIRLTVNPRSFALVEAIKLCGDQDETIRLLTDTLSHNVLQTESVTQRVTKEESDS